MKFYLLKTCILSLLLVITTCVITSTTPDNDEVKDLKGYPFSNLSKTHQLYSGYLNVSVHYMFLKKKNPANENFPIVLWMNGGPGCSSLLGLFQEIGPYVMNDGETEFSLNKFGWHNDAHLLFLETPLGVGFSSTNDAISYNDLQTADTNFYALKSFFDDKFPELKTSSKFWLAGESYAGIYIPYFAKKIIESELKLNWGGIMVGNGVLINDDSFNENVTVEFYYNRRLISLETKNTISNICSQDLSAPSCQLAKKRMEENLDRVNPYDIYGYCYYVEQPPQDAKPRNFPYLFNLKDSEDDSPCVNSYNLVKYLRNIDVIENLHIKTGSQSWNDCNHTIFVNYSRIAEGSIPVYNELLFKQPNFRILLYSGDTDAVVSLLNTQYSIEKMNVKVIQEWRSWKYGNDAEVIKIGGYIQEYDRFTLATVRGAGHMVPQWKREQAYIMFYAFLNGKNL